MPNSSKLLTKQLGVRKQQAHLGSSADLSPTAEHLVDDGQKAT
jgi:hypothetical protein